MPILCSSCFYWVDKEKLIDKTLKDDRGENDDPIRWIEWYENLSEKLGWKFCKMGSRRYWENPEFDPESKMIGMDADGCVAAIMTAPNHHCGMFKDKGNKK